MCARAWRFRSSQDDMRSILSVLMHTAYPDKEHTVQFLIWEAQKQQTFCCLILNITSVFISTTGVHEVVYVKRAVVWMNRQCRWAERRSWSVQKPIDLETRGCIQTVKELYREHSWHHQFHVHLFRSRRFLILYTGSFHMHSQGCTFSWKPLTWISYICTFYLLGQKTFRDGEICNWKELWLGSIQFHFSQFESLI